MLRNYLVPKVFYEQHHVFNPIASFGPKYTQSPDLGVTPAMIPRPWRAYDFGDRLLMLVQVEMTDIQHVALSVFSDAIEAVQQNHSRVAAALVGAGSVHTVRSSVEFFDTLLAAAEFECLALGERRRLAREAVG